MISLFYDDSNKVYLKYYADLPAGLKDKDHLQVDVVDDPEEKAGKVAVLYADKDKYWYAYEDKKLTEDELLANKVKVLADSQSNTEDLLQEIIFKMYQ
jgi:hypothetical protein